MIPLDFTRRLRLSSDIGPQGAGHNKRKEANMDPAAAAAIALVILGGGAYFAQ